MKGRPSSRGVGSNQYQTKPGGTPTRPDPSVRTAAVGLDDDPEDVAWAFHPNPRAWTEAGIESPHDAEVLEQAGMTPAGFSQWHETMRPEPAVCAAWHTAGFSPQEAWRWTDYGFAPETAVDWAWGNNPARNGWKFLPVEASEWSDAGFDPTSAAAWRHGDIEPWVASQWQPAVQILIDRDIPTADAVNWAVTLIKAGRSPDDSPQPAPTSEPDPNEVAWAFHPDRDTWTRTGFGTWTAARPWIEAGFDPDTAREWRDAGMEFAGDAAQWRDEGFQPTKARIFEQDGFTLEEAKSWQPLPAGLAGKWRDAQFTADDVQRWWVVNKFPFTDAVRWRDAGFGPAEARGWRDTARPQFRQDAPEDEVIQWAKQQRAAGTAPE